MKHENLGQFNVDFMDFNTKIFLLALTVFHQQLLGSWKHESTFKIKGRMFILHLITKLLLENSSIALFGALAVSVSFHQKKHLPLS